MLRTTSVLTTGSPVRHRAQWGAIASAVLSASLVLAGCSSPASAPAVTPTAEVTADATAEKSAAPEPVLPATWALTGMPASEPVNRPAVAIKVENSREARPQTGLEYADVVWEEIVEGGITRYIAVYHSQIPEAVGPIRSVRPMDSNIIAPLGGLMVFSGGQPPFVQSVRDVGLQAISEDGNGLGFYRTKDRKAPHNVFGTPATFLEQADATHQDSPQGEFLFAADAAQATAAVSGAPTSSIDVVMSGSSRPTWAWDAASETFLRSEGTTPAVSSTGAQLAAKNVVVLKVSLFNTQYSDPAGNPVPETQVVGTGEAVVATGGKSIAATWTKIDAAAPFSLTAADGTLITLAPGNTWVELVPTSSGSVTTS